MKDISDVLMRLIEYDNYELKVADEAYLVAPIRRLFRSDRTKDKERFFKSMSYLFFMCDPTSNYAYITDERERAAEVIRQEGLPKDFRPDKDLREAMDCYVRLSETASTAVLRATMAACEKIRKFLETFDPSERDDKDRFVLDINKFTKATGDIADLAVKLAKTERMVRQEQLEERKMRKGVNKSIMDMRD